jgi:hypothetical protein
LKQLITCPKCDFEFELEEALLSKLEDRVREDVAEQARVQARREYESEKAGLETEKQDLMAQVGEAAEKLSEARTKELAFLKRERELEAKAADVELQIEREVSAKTSEIEEKVKDELEEAHNLKERGYQEQLRQMKAKADELQRRIDQGSQEVQGEAAELTLEELLASGFPTDTIEPVPKGMRGADLLQRVIARGGVCAGTIIWESKHTKAWSHDWIKKLKRDQVNAKADIAVIASSVLPEGVDRFGPLEGVWVSDFRSALGLAAALRGGLIETARLRVSSAGKAEKTERLYEYLCGAGFARRVAGLVDSYSAMREQLDSERRSFSRQWARREAELSAFVENMAGMYGELQAIAGAALVEVPTLALPGGGEALEEPSAVLEDAGEAASG